MNYRIFVDFAPSRQAMDALREGTTGHTLVFPKKPAASVLVQAEKDAALLDADIAFGQPNPDMVAEAGRLKWIQISTSSIARYDNSAFREMITQRNILVTHSAGVYSEACAEHTLGFMLAEARQLPGALASRMPGGTPEWHTLRSSCIPLRGQSVLILGFGTIGQRLAELLKPFDLTLSAYRRKPRGHETVPVITADQLTSALANADHVVNILPDSPETQHFMNSERFAAMKPQSVFYNIGRGATVDQDALLEALRSGKLKSAWLDVTTPEPLPDHHPLRSIPNCYITPHTAGGHAEESLTLVRHFVTNFHRWLRGEPLIDRIL